MGEQGPENVSTPVTLTELAESLKVYNGRVDLGPEPWACVMAAGFATYGVGAGLGAIGFDQAVAILAAAFGLFWAALILKD